MTISQAHPGNAAVVAEYQLFIDGEWVESSSLERVEVMNPATERVIARVPQATRDDAIRAITAARRAFDEGPWPRMTVDERREVLRRMVDVLDRRRGELIELNIVECGTSRGPATVIQVGSAIEHLRDMVERVMPQFAWETPLPATVGNGVGQGVVVREAYGVAALISAYNFPLLLNIAKLAPALAAGCTTVLKPAPTTPLQALVLAEVAFEAGLPNGVLNVITGDVEIGRELSTNPGVDLVSFTGSDETGKRIYEQAAPTIKKVVLELGGKSPHIITEDADLAKAAQQVLHHTTLNAGQGCSLLTRTLVHRSRLNELVELLKPLFAGVKIGDPADPTTTMGPLISEEQRMKVEQLIATGVAEGARIVIGGGRPAGHETGYYVEPTVFVDVDNSMTIAQTEFFGPVNVIIPFDTDDEAVRIANDSKYGLYAAVRAKDPARAHAIARQLRVGGVMVNGGGGKFPTFQPFGGYKDSGLGREYGNYGLNEFLETKAIMWGVAQG